MNNKYMESNLKRRFFKDNLFKFLMILFAVIATLPLFLIFFFIFQKGIAAINWDFFVNLPKPVGETGGGIANALVGTFMLVSIASVLSVPFGLSVGIFLSEHRKGRFSYWVRLTAEILQGVPSIVIGIIAYLWVVKPMGGFSAFSGGIALSLMMLPIIIRSTEETLKLIPESLKEASLALGVPYSITVLKVVVPAGLSGIMTGIILSVSRVIGETAPLLFTSFGNPFMAYSIFGPVESLPLLIFKYAISPFEDWQQLAWGASLVLVVIVLFFNLISKLVARRWKVQF